MFIWRFPNIFDVFRNVHLQCEELLEEEDEGAACSSELHSVLVWHDCSYVETVDLFALC